MNNDTAHMVRRGLTSRKTLPAQDRVLIVVGFLIGLFLAFNITVWGTDLAIKPLNAQPCLGIWGELSCTSHPPVLVVTVAAAMVATAVVWILLRAGRRAWAVGLVVACLLVSAYVFFSVRKDCSNGLRLAREQSSPRWECIGVLK